jgi:hypothetical protein
LRGRFEPLQHHHPHLCHFFGDIRLIHSGLLLHSNPPSVYLRTSRRSSDPKTSQLFITFFISHDYYIFYNSRFEIINKQPISRLATTCISYHIMRSERVANFHTTPTQQPHVHYSHTRCDTYVCVVALWLARGIETYFTLAHTGRCSVAFQRDSSTQSFNFVLMMLLIEVLV